MTAAPADLDKRRKQRVWWLPAVEVLIFVLAFGLSLYVMPRVINADGDLGRHITIGNVLLDQRTMLRTDIFSHTMTGEDLVLHEWLSDLVIAAVHRAAGMNGIAWMTAFILASTYALFTAGLRLFDVRAPVRLLAGLAAVMVSAIHWHTRPHIFTTLLFTYYVLALATYYKTERSQILIPLPAAMILWANLHGAFVSGLVLVGLLALGLLLEKRLAAARAVAVLLVILVLSSWINPFGPRMLTHSFGYLQLDYLVDITDEYMSPDFHNPMTWPFLGILLLTVAVGWYSRRQVGQGDGKQGDRGRGSRLCCRQTGQQRYDVGWVTPVMLLFWTASALYSARNIPLYGQIAVLFLAYEGDRLMAGISPGLDTYLTRSDRVGRQAGGWVYAVVVGAALILAQAGGATLDYAGSGNRFDPDIMPVKAVDWLEETGLPEGNVFNEFTWGGYLLYRLWPEKQVFIDGQTDFYGPELTRTYLETAYGQGDWQGTLDEYQVAWAILPPERTLGKLLGASPAWEQVYGDETAQVWIRRRP